MDLNMCFLKSTFLINQTHANNNNPNKEPRDNVSITINIQIRRKTPFVIFDFNKEKTHAPNTYITPAVAVGEPIVVGILLTPAVFSIILTDAASLNPKA